MAIFIPSYMAIFLQCAVGKLGIIVLFSLGATLLASGSGLSISFQETGLVVTFEDSSLEDEDTVQIEGRSALDEASWGIVPGVDLVTRNASQVVFDASAFQDQASFFFRVIKNGEAATASFKSEQVVVSEGEFDQYALVQFSKPVFGTIHYRIEDIEGVTQSSGQITLNGESSAQLPLGSRVENRTIDVNEVYVVTLISGASDGFVGTTDGGQPGLSLSLLIDDNDSLWMGLLSEEGGGVPFGFKLLESENGLEAFLIADPSESVSSFLPDGEHAARTFNYQPGSLFAFESMEITLPRASAPFDQESTVTIQLLGDVFAEKRIEGTALLTTEFAHYPHLNFRHEQSFVLVRLPSPPPER